MYTCGIVIIKYIVIIKSYIHIKLHSLLPHTAQACAKTREPEDEYIYIYIYIYYIYIYIYIYATPYP